MKIYPGLLAILFLSVPALHSQDVSPDRKLAKGRTLLLVDDHDILYRSGTKRVVHPAKRFQDKALVEQARPWELAIGWTSIHRDAATGKYQLWYQAYAGKRAESRSLECVVAYAESKDGIHFDRPEFDLIPFSKEHPKTNIVLKGNGGYGDRYCNSVVVDPREKDPKRRYKMAYYDWSSDGENEVPGLHVAFSPDGIHWTKHASKGPLYPTNYGARGFQTPFTDESPIREFPVKGKPNRKVWFYPQTMADAVDVFWDPVHQVWVIVGKYWLDAPDGTSAWKHGMGRIVSKDFIHWGRPEFLLAPDDRDAPDVEFHTSPVFHHGERYFCLNQILNRGEKGAIDIELMTSVDGVAWERNFREAFFLPRAAGDQFDSRAMFTNSTPIILEDEIRFYYGAYNQSPIGGVSDATKPKNGVGMASIPRDRFGGIEPLARSAQVTLRKPLEHVGQVTFKPLDFKGCKEILLNADASKGSIRAELMNEDGYRVRGYSKDDSLEIQGDSLQHKIAWKDKTLDQLPPGRYLIRLHLTHSTIYAVRFP